MTAGDPPRKRGPRVSGPVVPARREPQRVERGPTVRKAGEVRGRTRPTARPDAWAAVPDLAMPVGPAGTNGATLDADLAPGAGVFDADVLFDDALPTGTLPARALGDITYDRNLDDPTRTGLPRLPLETVPLETGPLQTGPLGTGPLGTGPAEPLTVATPVVEPTAAPAPAAAPVPAPPRPRRSLFRRRTRVRRVSRVVRRVDAWSVLKISAIFYALAYAVLLVAGVLLWNLAQTTGTVANIEGFVRELFGLREFTIDGERLYKASWPIGVFLAVAGTGLNVTAAVMFNLITDLVGGVRVTVLEEEVRVIETPSRRRTGRRGRRSTSVATGHATGPTTGPSTGPAAGGPEAG